MQIKRQNLQKKSHQTVLFCNFQQLKPSYFAILDHTNRLILQFMVNKKHPRCIASAWYLLLSHLVT